jgi:hypothetical protein
MFSTDSRRTNAFDVRVCKWEGAALWGFTGKAEPDSSSVIARTTFQKLRNFAINSRNTETHISLTSFLSLATYNHIVSTAHSRSAHSLDMSGNTPKSMSNRLMTMKVSSQTRLLREHR